MTIKEATSLEKYLSSAIKKLASKWRALGGKPIDSVIRAFNSADEGSPDKESARREALRIESMRQHIATACTLLTSEHLRLSRALANNIGDHVTFRLACAANVELNRLWVLLK